MTLLQIKAQDAFDRKRIQDKELRELYEEPKSKDQLTYHGSKSEPRVSKRQTSLRGYEMQMGNRGAYPQLLYL